MTRNTAAGVAALVAGAALWQHTSVVAGESHRATTRSQHEAAAATATANALARRVADLQARLDAQPNVAAVAKRVEASVFTIGTTDGLGSGFVLQSTGSSSLLITNYHVVEDDWKAGRHQVKVRQEGAPDRDGTVEKINEADDLAVVRVAASLPVLSRGGAPAIGDAVLAVGAPLGLGNSVSTGIVSAFRDGLIQFSAPISPGNSGGPVVDSGGHVIGVARSKFVGEGAEGLSFAIPIALVCSTAVTC